MYKVYCRSFQGVMKVASSFMPWREPKLLEGENSLKELPQLIKQNKIESVLIVTDQGIVAVGLMDEFLNNLRTEGINFVIYDKTVPNPTIDNIEEAFQMYTSNHCKGIVAFGGGSPMDCAKGVGARAARPKKNIRQMKGVLKVLKKMPPLFAIPTTAGTGSEATLAAVVSNSETHEKYAIMDTALIPHYAVLDPLLIINLPKHITAATGIDALTHAVEAYIGKSNTKETTKYSVEAVKLIFENLYESYTNGTNIQARKNMQKAAYWAGMAFTRAYVGYVHAIAHTLGGFYSVPHGLANAIILPYVLEYYGESVHKPLAELAEVVGIGKHNDSVREKAVNFIEAIKKLNENMEIPKKVSGIVDTDIPLMVERALKEANPLYPVPRILNKDDLFNLYQLIKE
ncbi:iron-containing alcohol dehydrogenase [Neobacillus sp. MM2021_6]|uniref:iron-containing alcohol dehydrogenase n=1 Tax=Bacillaceae TaxID=186817 RepID=UPI00140A56DA|nr:MULTISPECIES: iron-containing alcohol dehydrogenase [Bacillaceae]MBO0960597.1 iron-containing alcohol dehydrogenase [Neobacillus sp. MM2021_6]NHC18617.1 iron-containing alcohol dehydrogenase [Bacillus sp. MM2020_4]